MATIVTSDPERAARAASRYPAAKVESDAEAVWERAGDHDFVVVATANDAHVPLAERAIDAGLAVVLEKPPAPSAAEARELIARAASADVLLTVFHNRRWDSDFLTLRRLIAAGDLGEVHRFESRFERWRPQLSASAWRESSPRAEGGGLLLDLGSHLVDQALTLFGPAAEVHGEVDARRGGPADDDDFVAILHESGVRSHLWASSVAAARGPRLRVQGSRGAFVVDELDGQETALREGKVPGEGVWGEEPEDRWGRFVAGEEERPVPAADGAWPEFYRRWEAVLRGEGAVPVEPADAVAVLEVLERAARAG